jgi:hypothetical protein
LTPRAGPLCTAASITFQLRRGGITAEEHRRSHRCPAQTPPPHRLPRPPPHHPPPRTPRPTRSSPSPAVSAPIPFFAARSRECPVTNLRIAVNHPDRETEFHTVVAWKRTAEVVAQFLRKGRLVEVSGFSRERTWTDKDGNERTSTEITAFSVQFLSRQRSPPAADTAAA